MKNPKAQKRTYTRRGSADRTRNYTTYSIGMPKEQHPAFVKLVQEAVAIYDRAQRANILHAAKNGGSPIVRVLEAVLQDYVVRQSAHLTPKEVTHP